MIRSQPRHFRDRFQDPPSQVTMPLLHCATSSQRLLLHLKIDSYSRDRGETQRPYPTAVRSMPVLRHRSQHELLMLLTVR